MNEEIKTGTTTVGLIAKDSVVLAADMRASMGHLASDEEAKKLYKITDNIAMTNAGSVGDSLALIRYLRSHAKLYEVERETAMTVKAIAIFLSNILNSNRFYPFLVQFIVGGMNNKPELYELDLSGGVLDRKKYAVSGSGTELALSVLDQQYKEGITKEEAIRLAINAVKAAKKRDIYSGGVSVTVMVITRQGIQELKEEEIKNYST